VPRWEPVHPDFLAALRILALGDVHYAEAWRLLRPVAARLDLARPSYWIVRRYLRDERRRVSKRRAHRDQILSELFRGLVPRF
jgi:hypothetical protein